MKKQTELLRAAALPLMTDYQTDLAIDARMIDASPDAWFVHATRQRGTHLYMMLPPDSPKWPAAGDTVPYLFGHCSRQQILDSETDCILKMTECPDASYYTWHLWNGDTLTKMTARNINAIVRRYARNTVAAWTRPKNRESAMYWFESERLQHA